MNLHGSRCFTRICGFRYDAFGTFGQKDPILVSPRPWRVTHHTTCNWRWAWRTIYVVWRSCGRGYGSKWPSRRCATRVALQPVSCRRHATFGGGGVRRKTGDGYSATFATCITTSCLGGSLRSTAAIGLVTRPESAKAFLLHCLISSGQSMLSRFTMSRHKPAPKNLSRRGKETGTGLTEGHERSPSQSEQW